MQGRVKGSTVGCRGSDWPLFLWGPLRALQKYEGLGQLRWPVFPESMHSSRGLGWRLSCTLRAPQKYEGFGDS